MIVSSHILSEISETCDRLLVIEDGRIAWSGTESQLSQEFDRGMQIEVTTRDATEGRVSELLKGVAGVQSVESLPPSEAGEGVVTPRVVASTDVRDAVCRALVQANLSVLGLVRRRELESMVLQLLSGEDTTRRPSSREGNAPVAAASAAASKELA